MSSSQTEHRHARPVIGRPVEHEGCVQHREFGVLTYQEMSELLLSYRDQMHSDAELFASGMVDLIGQEDTNLIRERMDLLGRLKDTITMRQKLYDGWARRMADVWEAMTPEEQEREKEIHGPAAIEETVEAEEEDNGVRVN